jgi:uncharacterized protein with FMN-binding domain
LKFLKEHRRGFFASIALAVLLTLSYGVMQFVKRNNHENPTSISANVVCLDQVKMEDGDNQPISAGTYLANSTRNDCISKMIQLYGTRIAQAMVDKRFNKPATKDQKAQDAQKFNENDKPRVDGWTGPGYITALNGAVCASVYWNGQDPDDPSKDVLRTDEQISKIGLVNHSEQKATRVWFERGASYWKVYRTTSRDTTEVTDVKIGNPAPRRVASRFLRPPRRRPLRNSDT